VCVHVCVCACVCVCVCVCVVHLMSVSNSRVRSNVFLLHFSLLHVRLWKALRKYIRF
jgi:hypothetical protein